MKRLLFVSLLSVIAFNNMNATEEEKINSENSKSAKPRKALRNAIDNGDLQKIKDIVENSNLLETAPTSIINNLIFVLAIHYKFSDEQSAEIITYIMSKVKINLDDFDDLESFATAFYHACEFNRSYVFQALLKGLLDAHTSIVPFNGSIIGLAATCCPQCLDHLLRISEIVEMAEKYVKYEKYKEESSTSTGHCPSDARILIENKLKRIAHEAHEDGCKNSRRYRLWHDCSDCTEEQNIEQN